MIFASAIFLELFLGCVLILYACCPGRRRSLYLTIVSFVFYGWWRPDFAPLMLFSASVDYFLGARIHASASQRNRKTWLIVSCVVNLGLLAWFKYADFAITTWNFTGGTWFDAQRPLLNLLLPVGISFYTFQSMSYTIDVYRREVEPTRSFIDFLCYVTFFPQLVAGPIVRYRDLADQLKNRRHSLDSFARGAWLFQLGFIKKVLIADALAPVADEAFGLSHPSFEDAWLGAFAYAFQIYFDFSGYSDMAIGLGRLFGFTFPENFDRPYAAQSITEFWRRWHISLSTWLRDYLYIPLGGNRSGWLGTHGNLMMTMLLGGLWHGAHWTFVAWGAWQGAWLVIERLAGKRALWHRLPFPFRIALTFLVTVGGWVWFRASDLPDAVDHFAGMLGVHGFALTSGLLSLDRMAITLLLVAAVATWAAPSARRIVERPRVGLALPSCLAFLAAVLHLWFQDYSPFLYFQF